MRFRHLIKLACALGLTLLVSDSRATVGPPIKLEIIPTPGVYPQAGQPYSASLELVSSEAGMVSDFSLEGIRSRVPGDRWQQTSFDLPGGSAMVDPLTPLMVGFTSTPVDPTEPVVITIQWNGQIYQKQFGLYPENLGQAGKHGGAVNLVQDPWGPDPRPANKSQIERVAPLIREDPQVEVSPEEAAEDAPREPGKGWSIRVKGRFYAIRGPDGQDFGADSATVRVKDEDWNADDTLHTFTTDPWGYFDETFYYNQGEDPDIYLQFEMANARVEVENSNIWENNYSYKTSTKSNYTGSFIDYGWQRPSNSARYPTVYILSTMTKTFRWIKNKAGFTTPSVDVQWPEYTGNSWYSPYWEEIHINVGKQWREDTMAHEYGHHWVENFADEGGTNYCNSGGRCDNPGDCGHCIWCEESAVDAWREGFPNAIADLVTKSLASDYGAESAALSFRDLESIDECDDVDAIDSAWITEGHLGALIRDIIDPIADDDPAYSQGFDALDLSEQEVFDLIATFEPITPSAFINRLYLQYPNLKSAIWQTAENNGYNFTDNDPPGAVTNLSSISHSTTGDSPDATIKYSWTAATDNLSGVDGYSIVMSTSPSTMPDPTKDIESTFFWTSPAVDPGDWWFHIRAVDNAGNWSSSAAHFGPITIREPYPADFTPANPSWPYGVMPSTNPCAWNSCPAPGSLPGNSQTYFNVGYTNNGELASTGSWKSLIYLDGTAVGGILNLTTPVNPGQTWTANGLGPFMVRGGRHTFGSMIDYDEQHAEQDENDNFFARTWVLSPLSLNTGQVVARPLAPPEPFGGFETVPLFASPNCDGFRAMRVQNTFYGVAMWADNDSEDYDLRLHTLSTGPTNGFGTLDAFTNGAVSSRPEGCVDFALFRYDVAGVNGLDAGVVNFDGGVGGFQIVKEWSPAVAMGSPVNLTLPADRHLIMREIEPLFAQTFTVAIDVDPAASPVQVALFDDNVGAAGLLDADALAVTDENGHAQFDFITQSGGPMCLVIFQDPKDVPSAKRGATIQVALHAYGTPEDLTSVTPSGWYAPLVPRPTNDGTFNSVSAPTSLVGNADQTYINWAWQNIGPNSSPYVNSRVLVDGQSKIYTLWGPVPPNSMSTSNSTFSVEVKGGRHTLHARYDVNDEAQESNEGNNGWGLQYVWSPLALSPGTPITREIPEPADAGWDDALAGGIVIAHPNADGLRTPGPTPSGDDGHWQAVAAMPGMASDVDLRLHEVSTGALDGFDDVRALSGWVTGQSEFVLTNYRVTPQRSMDVGVGHEEGSEDYVAEVVDSSFLGTDPLGDFGGFQIDAGKILNVHEVYLSAGVHNFYLEEVSGNVDWGISIHDGGLAYHSKEAGLEGGISWMADEGELESIYVDLPVSGYYAICVWKANADQLAKQGEYDLHFGESTGTTPPVAGVPQVTAFASIHPNPFNPRTTIAFDLARAGDVELSIYNVRGELVRQLLREARPEGRHQIVWDGIDDRGQQVASGAYFAQLRAGSAVEQKKLMLIK